MSMEKKFIIVAVHFVLRFSLACFIHRWFAACHTYALQFLSFNSLHLRRWLLLLQLLLLLGLDFVHFGLLLMAFKCDSKCRVIDRLVVMMLDLGRSCRLCLRSDRTRVRPVEEISIKKIKLQCVVWAVFIFRVAKHKFDHYGPETSLPKTLCIVLRCGGNVLCCLRARHCGGLVWCQCECWCWC